MRSSSPPPDDLNLLGHPAFDYNRRLHRVRSYALQRLDQTLRLDDLAVAACCEPRHLSRLFAREIGVSVMAWVRRVRLTAAKAALEHSDMPIDEIAAAAGFGSTRSMQRAFSEWVRCSPGEFRRRVRERQKWCHAL